MKKTMLWMGMMSLVMSAGAWAVLVPADENVTFNYGSDEIIVNSQVTLDGEVYTYTYQITSTDLHVFNFAVQLLPGSNAVNATYAADGVEPTSWVISDSPLIATALFGDLVNPGEVSATLSFDSSQAPTYGNAVVNGMTANFSFASAEGRIFTPIPEPATLLLLAVGAGVFIRRRKSC